MGWDYATYQQQPAPFVADILTFMGLEQWAQEQRQRDAEQRASQSPS